MQEGEGRAKAPRGVCGWFPDRGWHVQIVPPDYELSPIMVLMPEAVGPPSLAERYDALATLGYVVVRGGPEAWDWLEGVGPMGETFVMAYTEVRPLRLDELPAMEAGPEMQRTD
ncbi:hypothetical protein ACFY3G_14865 [Streptomyces phaeochromogenes]|uniref:hypothetical protein n=1 Tax=Streptomyces phaeochromogenes TaxID=1923 RepID=UPI003695E1BE